MTIPNLKLFHKKEIYLPTFRGLVLILGGLSLLLLTLVHSIYSFLAPTRPVSAEVMVVEGWVPDYVLQAAVSTFNTEKYQYLLTVGVPLSVGEYLSEYKTTAELSAASLQKMGISADKIVSLPANSVKKDRTYTSMVEVKRWLSAHPQTQGINLITSGVHARRSHYLLRQVVPSSINVGVIAIEEKDFAPEQWWRSSAGVRSVFFEAIAYVYVLVF
ncbi:ElyC/SanA/YdcF family protein [Deltaproteobacteria bacterium TL4]